MGVANIPEQKDQRESNEWISLKSGNGKMETTKGKAEDFITVVSVGNQGETSHPENFVTVLSIGSGRKDDEETPVTKTLMNGVDPHLEEEVEVYRLPGERLGFGLKFEGGNKTSERVKRLFIQSCADQSPASRTKCSWGCLGEGDEILSIDGVPVILMTRLDCVRRLKESQLVIKLVVRCRGALRPEVVSAERKSTPEKSKIPPELPSAPPPVPPRKLRHPRGSADGEANPSPVKKSWDTSKSVPTSQNSSPQSQSSFLGNSNGSSKSSAYESCYSSPKSGISSKNESPKAMLKDYNQDVIKFKQEPPEAMVYLDARTQDASSTHGSTSDETSSSLSTVVDRFSSSDRVSTISTASTASIASEQYGAENTKGNLTNDHYNDNNKVKEFLTDGLNLHGMLAPLDQLELEFTTNPPDYLLTRLANSEAVTHVESRGDVERVTTVVAPNTVLIEETITLQPPLSFQDAPLSYGHELSPGIFYTDLAADSKTHFRPIKDDASIVESIVNGDVDHPLPLDIIDNNHDQTNSDPRFNIVNGAAPPLPIRNHVNRICVSQVNGEIGSLADDHDDDDDDVREEETPVLPPKPMPRKDLKAKRKRPPPPPPPPNSIPRREVPPVPREKDQAFENRKFSGSIETIKPSNHCELKREFAEAALNLNSNYLENLEETKNLENKSGAMNLERESNLEKVTKNLGKVAENLEGEMNPQNESKHLENESSHSERQSKSQNRGIARKDSSLEKEFNLQESRNFQKDAESPEKESHSASESETMKLNSEKELNSEESNSEKGLNLEKRESNPELEKVPKNSVRESRNSEKGSICENGLPSVGEMEENIKNEKCPIVEVQTNKILDIIEMKIKMSDECQQKQSLTTNSVEDIQRIREISEESRKSKMSNCLEKRKLNDMSNEGTLSLEIDDSEDEKEEIDETKNNGDKYEMKKGGRKKEEIKRDCKRDENKMENIKRGENKIENIKRGENKMENVKREENKIKNIKREENKMGEKIENKREKLENKREQLENKREKLENKREKLENKKEKVENKKENKKEGKIENKMKGNQRENIKKENKKHKTETENKIESRINNIAESERENKKDENKRGNIKREENEKEENKRNDNGEGERNLRSKREINLLAKEECDLDERMKNGFEDFEENGKEDLKDEVNGAGEIDDCKLIMNESPIERLENICSDVENLPQEIEIKRCYKREELMDDEDDTSEESDAGDYYWQSNLATIGEEEETNSLEYTNANKEVNDLEVKAEMEKDMLHIPGVVVKECSKNVRDEVDCVRQITKDFGTEDKKPDKSPVNGRMDNCGGGQRLPPDGDEFPAAYQEFTNPGQYQFVASTNISTMATNGNLLCQNQTYVASESFQVHPKTNNQSIEKIQIVSQCVVDHMKEPSKAYKQKPIVISERKIEISGYYPKEVPSVDSGFNDLTDNPPPLPLTEPPKADASTIRNNSDQSPRKFSSNGELWRQDDKSERSVRDKIAMFSSQSSLEVPLFPNQPANFTGSNNSNSCSSNTNNNRRLSKHKSSDDVFADEKVTQKDFIKGPSFVERTQSSFDLSSNQQSSPVKYVQRPPSLPKSSPPSDGFTFAKAAVTNVPQIKTPEAKQYLSSSAYGNKSYTSRNNLDTQESGFNKSFDSSIGPFSAKSSTPTLVRATSFSGGSGFNHERPQTSNEVLSTPQISRTNSLVSTFRKPNEELRRSSLSQLIEQRRKGISKLRGLIIPEKDAVPVDQAIIDLPEIKSRDSILINQVPMSSIQDKWGSQSSLASNTSAVNVPVKATTSFKMPAPQILSKYSPAFKRKSLSVYNTGNSISPLNYNITNNSNQKVNQVINSNSGLISDAPKSLESICSPTRSDYSFEYLSSTGSPENLRSRPRIGQKKTRADYDDSDNDSAVSSSQSSISRGFSPPMSPVPSDRSTMSSDRSYISSEMNYQRRTLILESPIKNNESIITEGNSFSSRPTIITDRTYLTSNSERSSIGSPNPRPPTENSKNSQIPQRQVLKRTNSSDTNCSSSSTLTSGSQASAESLSRRVLKPQSVEAINRKNILASAKCRSGRDLNGSPLIQRKFSDDEEASEQENGTCHNQHSATNGNGETHEKEVKIAYIEITEDFIEDEKPIQKQPDEPKLPPKRSIPQPVGRPPKSENLEPSNDLKMWVRTEAKNLAEKASNEKTIIESSQMKTGRCRSSLTLDEQSATDLLGSRNRTSNELDETDKNKIKSKYPQNKSNNEGDLLTILTTKSRSRSAIHVEENSYGKSTSQMSLEDILTIKSEPKLTRAQSVTIETTVDRNGSHFEKSNKLTTDLKSPARRSNSSDAWSDEKTFISKIPALNKPKVTNNTEETLEISERSRNLVSKIPTPKSLGRRSASVTDMKKAFEKTDSISPSGTALGNSGNNHNRFPSLDSSVEESIRPVEGDTERFCSEQFGSISSLASSTSLISQQELAQLVEEASLEEARGSLDVIVVLLHKENPAGSVGITLAGGVDCEAKEITVHRVLSHSIADKDGRVQRGDRILSINGRSTRGLSHRESLAVLKQPRSEVVLVVSRARLDEGCKLRTRTESVETIVEGYEINGGVENTAWGPPSTLVIYKDGAGLGFSLEGGRDSPLGDRPLIIKKIFTGGAAEKTGALKAGDQLLEVNGNDVTRMSRIEAWSLMKKLHDGEVNLLVRHPATKSS